MIRVSGARANAVWAAWALIGIASWALVDGGGVLAESATTVPAPAPGDGVGEPYRLCRKRHGDRDCLTFERSCPRGLQLERGGKAAPCGKLNASQCAELEKLLDGAFEYLKARPAAERTVDSPLPMSCDGLFLVTPNHAVTACASTQSDAAVKLLNVFLALRRVCDG